MILPRLLGGVLVGGVQPFVRGCSTMGAQQTLKVKQKIEEKRQAALLGGKLDLILILNFYQNNFAKSDFLRF